MLDKLLGGESKPFLVLSEESTTEVVIAPTRPEEPEADEASTASEAPILFAQGVAPAQPAAAQAKPAAAKAQPKPTSAKPEKALTTAVQRWQLACGPEGGWTPCLLYTSPSPRDATLSRMPSSA